MDSEEEYEAFQVTGEDLLNEFGGRRRRRKFRKEDAIYGMWAEHDSEEDDKNDITKGIDFVSSSKDEDVSEPEEQDINQQIDFIMNEYEQKKLEEGEGKREMGGTFKAASLEQNRQLHMFPTKQQTEKPSVVKKKPKRQSETIAAKRKRELMVSDRDWGKWEKHTTGFGSKMLQKMGYVPGKGLGRKGEGIINPVKASKNKELGKASERMPVSVRPAAMPDSEEEEEEETFKEELEQWRVTGNKKTSVKYNFKTLDELRETSKLQGDQLKGGRGSGFLGGESKVKVIDMTGKKTRVLSSYGDLKDQLGKNSSVTEELFLPELMHNLELLVDQTEHDIIQTDRQYRYNQDLIVNLTHERGRLKEELIEEEDQIEKLSGILTVVDTFEQRLKGGSTPLSLAECEQLLSHVKLRFPHEYKLYELSSLAIAVAFPIFKSLLGGWDPLSDPSGPLPLFHQWKEILREQDSAHQTIPDIDQMDPYDRLTWEVWMPIIRQVLLAWQPKTQVEVIIDFIQVWMPLLPDWILNNILDNLVLPRLQTEVDRWDPMTDPMPIHLWIHPWQPLMESSLSILYPTIRRKLGMALNNLQPMDYSPHVILKPWIKVFSPDVMEAFLSRTVIPKLVYCLQSLVINPQNENIAPVKWILSWTELIPIHHFVDMFVKYFFPKWLQILATWLSGNPNYDEVTKWFSGWKGLFPSQMSSDPLVKSNLNRALSLMDHAAHGTLVPGMRENMAYFITSERRAAETQKPAKTISGSLSTSVSFKDIVEKKAEEFGLLFMPTSKKYEGKTLYTFGSVPVYIDRGILFVSKDKKWTPMSLEELAEYSFNL